MPTFYASVLISLIFLTWFALFFTVLRRIRRTAFETVPTDDLPDLDWSELDYLLSGSEGVFHAAAVWFVQNGYGDYEPTESRLTPVQPLPANVPPAVRILAAGFKPGVKAYRTGAEIARQYDAHFKSLENRKLIVPRFRRFERIAYPTLLVLASWLTCGGCILICNHFFGDEPKLPADPGFVVMVISFAGGAILFLGSLLFWTWVLFTDKRMSNWGVQVLRKHQQRQWPDRGFFQIFGPVPGTEHNLALAVALFGLVALKKTPLAHMMSGLTAPDI